MGNNYPLTDPQEDHFPYDAYTPHQVVWVSGPVIVGAGPSGLATAACLRDQGVPFVVVEKSDCIASLWQRRAYDRLQLHLPKKFCQLPNFPFPAHFPQYPTKHQFISYLQSYAETFDVRPRFNECVLSAEYDRPSGLWRVRTVTAGAAVETEYVCRWVVVATGENAERVLPAFDWAEEFGGEMTHVCEYKCGEKFRGKKVLVVGCGNSGMEVSLDLSNFDAEPFMVVRDSVHVLPREVMGKSTFELAVALMRWLPLWLVDKLLLILAWFVLGNVERYGLKRPSMGPLELKNTKGKTPVLDIGAVDKIRHGEIKVIPGIRRFFHGGAELVNGKKVEVDSVILATGYRSNVPSWLKEKGFFSEDGYPRSPFPNGWKGKNGLYAVGFTRRGLSGASQDAVQVAGDIGKAWKEETRQNRTSSNTSSTSSSGISWKRDQIICISPVMMPSLDH